MNLTRIICANIRTAALLRLYCRRRALSERPCSRTTAVSLDGPLLILQEFESRVCYGSALDFCYCGKLDEKVNSEEENVILAPGFFASVSVT